MVPKQTTQPIPGDKNALDSSNDMFNPEIKWKQNKTYPS